MKYLNQLKKYSEMNHARKTISFEKYKEIFEKLFPEYILAEKADYSQLQECITTLEKERKIKCPKSQKKWFIFHGMDLPEEFLLIVHKIPKFGEWKNHHWHPLLANLSSLDRMQSETYENLLKIEKYLQENPPLQIHLAEKERSLQIFGDEKLLGQLHRKINAQFGIDVMSIVHSYPTYEPLTGYHFPKSKEPTILFVENRDPFFNLSLISTFLDNPPYAHIYYGQGLNFLSIIETLPYKHSKNENIEYFGDIDPTGFYIPIEAKKKLKLDYPEYSIQFASKLYKKLISIYQKAELCFKDKDRRKLRSLDLNFLDNNEEKYVKDLLSRNERIPQELLHIGELIDFYELTSIPDILLNDHNKAITYLLENFD